MNHQGRCYELKNIGKWNGGCLSDVGFGWLIAFFQPRKACHE